MVTLISKNSSTLEKLSCALEQSEGKYLNRNYYEIASQYLTVERAAEQIELFKCQVNKFANFDFKGKKLLEIGAGVGALVVTARAKYGIDACGIDSSCNEFLPFKEISCLLLKEYNLPEDALLYGNAECLPYSENTFDLVYSTNVLEHIQDPRKVLSESIRVLKSGGFLQFVIPNYFSFWEGHYGIIWPCITNKLLAKFYVKLFLGNPKYIDFLCLVSPFSLRNILKDFESQIEILDWGKEIFKKRLETGEYTDWASLSRIRLIVNIIKELKISSFVAYILNTLEMYTPIVLTIRKK